MLSIKAQYTLQHAKTYFKEHLQVGDYYSQEHKTLGQWIGKGAELLALQGPVQEQAFLNLVQGLHPKTGDRLTQRLNTFRETEQGPQSNRRLFYDFCFSPPKSVSIVAQLQDGELKALHQKAVTQALKYLETYAGTRVRKGGVSEDRLTQNLVAACFQHDTSRALDPHLHTHCIVMNVTWDAQEQKWKALQNKHMLQAQQTVYQCYLKTFAEGLEARGYTIERNSRDFEIKGVLPELIKTFSKRHEQIEVLYQSEKTKVSNQYLNEKALKAQLAYNHRDRKIKGITHEALQEQWQAQLTSEASNTLDQLRTYENMLVKKHDRLTLKEAFEQAESSIFERQTFTTKEKILAQVTHLLLDYSPTWEDICAFLEQRDYLRDPFTGLLTLPSILEREHSIVQTVKQGKGLYAPLKAAGTLKNLSLSREQATAVTGILASKDFAMLLKGSAGTGKSFTLKVLIEELKGAGHSVALFVPQRQQVLDLGKEGLEAQTVAQLLNQNQKELVSNSVWIIDEAGQIGGKQMEALLHLAQKSGSRIIFSGDTQQHGAVETTDSLQLLERYAQLQTFRITQIRRQDPKQGTTSEAKQAQAQHKQAVKAAVKGNALKSIQILNTIGCIQSAPKETGLKKIAKAYTDALVQNKKCLVVSQTNEAVTQLHQAIKSQLKAEGRLGTEQTVQLFGIKDLTHAQKQDSAQYTIREYAYFHKKYGSIKSGDCLPIIGKTDTHLILNKDGKQLQMSLKYSSYFNVCQAQEHSLAKGEILQVKFNGVSQEGKSVHNGEQLMFLGLDAGGNLNVQDEQGFQKTIDKDHALLRPRYALTSYAAQGKTVDQVFIYDAQNTLAVNQKEWYVFISRSKEPPMIYTDNKEKLFENVLQSGDRGLGMDSDSEQTLHLQECEEYYLEKGFEIQSPIEPCKDGFFLDLKLENMQLQQQEAYFHHRVGPSFEYNLFY